MTWQLLPTLGVVDPRFFPTATETWRPRPGHARPGVLAQRRAHADRAGAIGLLIATVLGALLGTVIGLVPFLRRATHTTVEFLRPIPSVALIPLAVLMYGISCRRRW